jgi:hypothetical protein
MTQPIHAVTVYFLQPELRNRSISKMPVTEQSKGYRKRASELARLADREVRHSDRMKLVTEALHWISLAENEEIIADAEHGPEK